MEGILVFVIIIGVILYLPSRRDIKGFEGFKKILTKDQIAQIKSFEQAERIHL